MRNLLIGSVFLLGVAACGGETVSNAADDAASAAGAAVEAAQDAGTAAVEGAAAAATDTASAATEAVTAAVSGSGSETAAAKATYIADCIAADNAEKECQCLADHMEGELTVTHFNFWALDEVDEEGTDHASIAYDLAVAEAGDVDPVDTVSEVLDAAQEGCLY